MNKIKLFASVLTLAFCSTLLNAGTVKESTVPQKVKDAVTKSHPKAKVSAWEMEGANYETDLKENGKWFSVLVSPMGAILETEMEIPMKEVPAEAINYMSKNFKGKKIKEYSKITKADGTVVYELEMDKKDYLFDSKGMMVK